MKLLLHPSLPSHLPKLFAGGFHVEVTHWDDVGPPQASLAEVLAFAAADEFIVISGDLGLAEILLAKPAGCPSVLQVRGVADVGAIIPEILGAISQASGDLRAGALVTLDIKSTGNTLRMLPLNRPDVAGEGGAIPRFAKDAFLPPDALRNSEWSDRTLQYANLCIAMNRVSVMRLQDVKIPDGDGRAMLALMLFSQATTSFEASCRLAAIGMEGEARFLGRSCVEAAIYGFALAAIPEIDLAGKLNAAYRYHYESWLTALKEEIGLQEDDPLGRYIRGAVSGTAASAEASVNLRALAKAAGIGDVYAVLYRFLSAEGGHPTWDSLRKVAAHDDGSGNLIGISIRPRFEQVADTLSIAATCQIVALKGFQKMFPDRDIDGVVSIFEDMLRDFAVQLLLESRTSERRPAGDSGV
ncbi:DUF5615 family PIN-like protein [Rugamonas aquatica]|uniref:DUF5615 domain-containing protein n=1 Tax=Rugamonas aquatica TaxID=2743357 RepID=A0A6A7N4Z6_9BURK|nr:DUF5677 domain-containing protein [Rugamonas aquatica]MQA40119.1 hypothetical protein [Rugamonas aquatica]